MVWRFSSADREGPFAWSFDDPVTYRDAMEKLHQFETMEETVIRTPPRARDPCDAGEDEVLEPVPIQPIATCAYAISSPNSVAIVAIVTGGSSECRGDF